MVTSAISESLLKGQRIDQHFWLEVRDEIGLEKVQAGFSHFTREHLNRGNVFSLILPGITPGQRKEDDGIFASLS